MSNSDARKRCHWYSEEEGDEIKVTSELIEEANREEYELFMAMKRSERGESSEDAIDATTNQSGDAKKVLLLYSSPSSQYFKVENTASNLASPIMNKTLEAIEEGNESFIEKTIFNPVFQTSPSTPSLFDLIESHENCNLTALEVNNDIHFVIEACENTEAEANEKTEVEANEITEVEVNERTEVEANKRTEVEGCEMAGFQATQMFEAQAGDIEFDIFATFDLCGTIEVEAIEKTEVKTGEKTGFDDLDVNTIFYATEMTENTEVNTSETEKVEMKSSKAPEIEATEKSESNEDSNEGAAPTTMKISFDVHMNFDPCDYVEDPNERKLPDLRSNRADPIGYVAMYPRKGAKLNEETRKVYSRRMQESFDEIQKANFAKQRRSLTYIKWAPPITLQMETDVRQVPRAEEAKTKKDETCMLQQQQQKTASHQNEMTGQDEGESHMYDDTELWQNNRRSTRNKGAQKRNESGKATAAASTVTSERNKITNANLKLQMNEAEDDDDDFEQPPNKRGRPPKKNSSDQRKSDEFDFESSQNKRTYSRRGKSSGGPAKNKDEGLGKRLASFYKPPQGKKVKVYDYPDDDEEEEEEGGNPRLSFLGLNLGGSRKSLPKTNSGYPSKRSVGASTSGVTTRSAAQEAERSSREVGEPIERVECPMCGVSFSAVLIDSHAYRCQGKGK